VISITLRPLHLLGKSHRYTSDTSYVHVRREDRHGRRKRKMAPERRKSFVLKQMYFSVNSDNAIALKHFDLRYSAVWRFRNVNSCLKMPIQYISSHPVRSILILSAHLHIGLRSGLFPSSFPTNIPYAFLFSPFVLPAQPISSSIWSL
jgi:hypothetical protein